MPEKLFLPDPKVIGAIVRVLVRHLMCMVWHQIGDRPFLLGQCHIIAHCAPHNEDIIMQAVFFPVNL